MLRAGFALWFGLGMLLRMQAQPLADAAPAMARSISSLLPRRATVSLEFQAQASVPAGEWSNFRAALRDELRKTGAEVADSTQPEWHVRVVVSENARGLLLIGEVVNNDTRQIVMAPWTRPGPAQSKPDLRIQITPISDQPQPILDVLMFDSGTDLLMLSPSKVSAFHLTSGKWIPNGQASLAVTRPVPRDARGRLELSAGGVVRAFLPGTTCTSPMNSSLLFTCAPANEPWPLSTGDSPLLVRWVSDRNVLESEGVRGSFFNAAGGWFASSNGKIENRAGEAMPGTEGWGSDLALVENPCGTAKDAALVAIVTSATADTQHDQLQSFAVASDPPVAASEPLPVPGAVTALWSAERPAHATLVVRNSKTGNYEASRLSLACTE